MKILVTTSAEASKASALAVLVPEGVVPDVRGAVGKTAQTLTRRKEWKGKFRDGLLVYGAGGTERVILVGLGKEKEIDAERIRRAAAIALKQFGRLEQKTLGIRLQSSHVAAVDAASAIAEGLVMASYRVPTATKKKQDDPYRAATVRVDAGTHRAAYESGVARGVAIGEASNLARDLGDLPGNVLTPTKLAQRASAMAKGAGLTAKVYRKPDLERMKMGGILGVNLGSIEPPVLIELSYRPRSFKKTVCLVGKGLTFDTGGISLKPSANMEEMKYDMCGGAAVIGAMAAVARLKPKVRVIGIVPSTDNMPSGSAQKPGDRLVTASGLTVEVINTDAEGRLILSDGLHHATTFDPDYIVDLATLTGACVVALGHDAAGLYGTDDKLIQMLKKAGDEAGDHAWPMPIFDGYKDDMKSDVADMKNIGKREGGAGSAAWFLSQFVDGFAWAHLDIAGTAWGQRNRDYVGGKCATGAGVRLLVRFLESLG